MDTLITVKELHSQLDKPDLALFDCRFSLMDAGAGLASYARDHLPGAHYADLERDLSGPATPGTSGRHPLPGIEEWCETIRGWGLGNEMRVVAYDDSGGAFAARLWWLLRYVGHQHVAVLDGGWQAWLESDFPTRSAIPEPLPRSSFLQRPELTRVVEGGALYTGVTDRSLQLLDARELPRFRGESEPIDPVAGHIPGAICLPFGENLAANGTFKTPDQLARRFMASLDEGGDRPVVCYCGSGVTACHNVLAMVHGGLPEPCLYPGSWSEWITDPRRPVETG
jgi:thiosulfate/3-mercaptopyruvate sulfurtransferase